MDQNYALNYGHFEKLPNYSNVNHQNYRTLHKIVHGLRQAQNNASRTEDMLDDVFGWEKLTVDEGKCDIVTP